MTQSSQPGRTRLSAADRRQAILDAALTVFGREGYRDGTLQQVAVAAGLSQQGLLHYFPTKSELLLATLDHWQGMAEDEFREYAGSDVRAVGRAFLDRNSQRPGLMRLRVVISAEATNPTHPAHERMRTSFDAKRALWVNLLNDGIRRGIYRSSLDASAVAAALVSLLDGLQLQYLLAPDMDLFAPFDVFCDEVLTTGSVSSMTGQATTERDADG